MTSRAIAVPRDCELVMDEDHEVTATFESEPVEEFELTIEMPGTGSGTVECEAEEGPEACVDLYPEDTELRLIPKADTGSEFVEWSGDCSSIPCDLTMDEDHTVAATFEFVGPALTIEMPGTGSGVVKCEVECRTPRSLCPRIRGRDRTDTGGLGKLRFQVRRMVGGLLRRPV